MRFSLIADVNDLNCDELQTFYHNVMFLFIGFFAKHDLPYHFMHHKHCVQSHNAHSREFIQWELGYDRQTRITCADIATLTGDVLKLNTNHVHGPRIVLEVNGTILRLSAEAMQPENFNSLIGKALSSPAQRALVQHVS